MAKEISNSWGPSNILQSVIRQENLLGYGSLYWNIYAFLLWAIKLPVAFIFSPMRIVSFISMSSIPVVIYLMHRRNINMPGLFPIIVWMIMPLAWWTGKITGPETLCMGLSFIGLYYSMLKDKHEFKTHSYIGGLFIGLTLGIKFTVMPLVLFILLYKIFYENADWKKSVLFLGFISAGFLIANPVILVNNSAFINNLQQSGGVSYPSLTRLKLIVFGGSSYTWDLVFNGSLTTWGMSFITAVIYLLALLICRVPSKLIVILAVVLLSALLFFSSSKIFYGWYWFPTLLVLPVFFYETRKSFSIKYLIMFITLLIFTALPNIKLIFEQLSSHKNHSNILKQKEAVQDFLITRLLTWQVPFDAIFDFSDFGTELETPLQYRRHSSKGWNAYSNWFNIDPFLNEKVNLALILIGDRIAGFEPYKGLKQQIETGSVMWGEKKFYLMHQDRKDWVSLYVISRKE